MEHKKLDFIGLQDDGDFHSDGFRQKEAVEKKNICRHDVDDVIINPPSPPLPPSPEGFRLSYYETYEQFFNLYPEMAGTLEPDFSMGYTSQKFRKIIWVHNETSEIKIIDEKLGEPKTMILCGGSIDNSVKMKAPSKDQPLIWRLLFNNPISRFFYNHKYLIVRLLLLLCIAGLIWLVFIK